MDEFEVKAQIDQMVNFILQEASEKANEINAKANEEFNIEKLRIIEAEKAKIKKEFERRQNQIEIQKRIAFSNEVNQSRLRVLRAQEELVEGLIQEVRKRLAGLDKQADQYKKLLRALIVQGAKKMMEPTLFVRCRKKDQSIVEGLLKDAASEVKKATQLDLSLKLDSSTPLPPPPAEANGGLFCCGGVVLLNADKSIICDNTLDKRLDIVIHQRLPEIKVGMFGAMN